MADASDIGEWEIPQRELNIFHAKHIGQGSFADVYLAEWRETVVVAKVFNAYTINEKCFLIEREIDIMTKLHHPNIVQILGYVKAPFTIVMEYIPRGDLLQNLRRLKKAQKLQIMEDCLQSLCYFHNRRPLSLIHRDIKLSNILLTKSRTAKIADFGLSRLLLCNQHVNSQTSISSLDVDNELTRSVGTARYKAPEMTGRMYTNKVDVYALGIVFYELLEEKRYDPKAGFEWSRAPSTLKQLICECMLGSEPSDRKSAGEILRRLREKRRKRAACWSTGAL